MDNRALGSGIGATLRLAHSGQAISVIEDVHSQGTARDDPDRQVAAAADRALQEMARRLDRDLGPGFADC